MNLVSAPALILAALSLTLTGAPQKAAVQEEKPWALRNHFTFTLDNFRLEYAEDSAEWRVRQDESRVLAEKTAFAIELADGRTITPSLCGPPSTTYGKATHALGDGAEYVLQFAPKDGLRVTHRLMTFKAQPFALLHLSVENVGTAPVAIKKLCPATFGLNSLSAWQAGSQSSEWRFGLDLGFPRFGPDQPCIFKLFHDPQGKATLALGILPTGESRAGIELDHGVGEVRSAYEPALRLAPGKTVESDTLWLSYAIPDPEQVQGYYVTSLRAIVQPAKLPLPQMTWCSVPAGTGFDQLLIQAKAWRGAGIGFALIPGDWESAPGSLKGNSARYPESMAKVMNSLRKEGLAAGLTVDPLAGEKEWLNPASDEGKAAVVQRIGKIRDWGVRFLAVEASAIPGEELQRFALTRAEANRRALEQVAEAAGGLPVFPAAISNLPATPEPWLETADFAKRMTDNGLTPAPIRLLLDANTAISDKVSAAIRRWPGALEVVGSPVQGLGRISAAPRAQTIRMDAGNPSPRFEQRYPEGVLALYRESPPRSKLWANQETPFALR